MSEKISKCKNLVLAIKKKEKLAEIAGSENCAGDSFSEQTGNEIYQ
jgi:hypothetical protein